MTPDRIIEKLRRMAYGARWGAVGWSVERTRSGWMVSTADEMLLTADPVKAAALIRRAENGRGPVDIVDTVDQRGSEAAGRETGRGRR